MGMVDEIKEGRRETGRSGCDGGDRGRNRRDLEKKGGRMGGKW